MRMKLKDLTAEKRMEFFRNIGPKIAEEMSKTLQGLTGENITVGFTDVESSEESAAVIEVNEKCFGSYIAISDGVEGVAVLFFPLSSVKNLVELLLKKQLNGVAITDELKLSAFKEAANILLLNYVTGLANALGIKLKTSTPKFTCFKSAKFARSVIPLKSDSLMSVGKFNIVRGEAAGGGGSRTKNTREVHHRLLRGALLLFFDITSKR